MGDTLERRRQRDEQAKQQRDSRKLATANFLKNYLDPKDFLSGTTYDPVIVKGLNDLMAQGAELATQGVDAPNIMMALGPNVSRLSGYSTKAKTIQKGIEDQLKGLKESGVSGIDFSKLKDSALSTAFQNKDGKLSLDTADPNTNYVNKVMQDRPEDFTTSEGLDEYAKKSPMTKTLSDVSIYSSRGGLTRSKAHVIGQNWLMQEEDEKGATTLVPRYDVATDDGKPIMESYTDQSGKPGQRQVRMLEEGEFDRLMKSNVGANAYIRGQINEALRDFEKQEGRKISRDSPEAKRLARAVAYQELDKRKASTIENIDIKGKPSAQEVRFRIDSSPEGLQLKEDQAEAAKKGRAKVEDPGDAGKTNVFEAIGKIARNDPDFTSGKRQVVKGRNVIDVTSALPGGGLKKGRGEDERYKSVYWDPVKRELIVETETKDKAGVYKSRIEDPIPEKDMGGFLTQIAEANGVPRGQVRNWLDKVGYRGGKFEGVGNPDLVKELDKPTGEEPETKAINRFEKDGGSSGLNKAFKGKKVGDKEVLDISSKWFGDNAYKIKLKGLDGKTETKEFKDKAAVVDFLKNPTRSQKVDEMLPIDNKGERIRSKSTGKIYKWDSVNKKYIPE